MLRVHHCAQPEMLDLDVLETLGGKSLDVVFMAVGRYQQVESLLGRRSAGRKQVQRDIPDRLFEEIGGAFAATIDEDVKTVRLVGNADVNAVATADVVGTDQQLI